MDELTALEAPGFPMLTVATRAGAVSKCVARRGAVTPP